MYVDFWLEIGTQTDPLMIVDINGYSPFGLLSEIKDWPQSPAW